MERNHKDWLVRYLFSPYGLAMISYVVFLAAVLFPPRLYSSVMEEPNYMFLDPTSVLFFTLCTASFLAGVWLIGATLPVKAFVDRPIRPKLNRALFLVLPILLPLTLTLLRSEERRVGKEGKNRGVE